MVDEIGDIKDATQKAAEIAELETYKVVYAGQEMSAEDLFFQELQKIFDIGIRNTEAYVFSKKFIEFFDAVMEDANLNASYTCTECLIEID